MIRSDWAIIGDDTEALTHDILMRIASGDKSERVQEHVYTLAMDIYGPQHDDRAKHMHTAEELEPLKVQLRGSIKRLRDELDRDAVENKKQKEDEKEVPTAVNVVFA